MGEHVSIKYLKKEINKLLIKFCEQLLVTEQCSPSFVYSLEILHEVMM